MARSTTAMRMFGVVFAAGVLSAVTLASAGYLHEPSGADDWSAEEKQVLASLSLTRLPAAPVDPSNAVERLPAAIDLGKRLFSDARISRNGAVSCASCHDPDKQFQDGLPVGQGVGAGSRRAMPIVGAAYSTWLFWDGRKDSLWSQALGPLEDAVEHGGTRTRYARLIAANYRKDYEALFGALPDLEGLPLDASPLGDAVAQAAWNAMDARRRDEVSRVFANIGKAIAAYEKSLRHEPSRFDRYVDAVVTDAPAARGMLRANEVRGLRLFIGKGQCVSCHNGPLLTDQQFHNTGVPPRNATAPDRGRAAATKKVLGDEFNCRGPFNDAGASQCPELQFMVADDPALEGAFKTPGLRGVAQRPPYMHAGQFASLERVVRHYVAAPHAVIGRSELSHRHEGSKDDPKAGRAPIELTETEIADLVSFLGTLNADRSAKAATP